MNLRAKIVLRLLALAATVVGVGCGAATKDERWLRVSAEDFSVITSLREKEARGWAEEFAQYVAALRGYFHFTAVRLPPLTMVVFEAERDFASYRPLDARGKPQAVGGFFARRESWAVAGLPGGRMSEEVRLTVFHEGTHWFLSVQETPNPSWLEEGLAEVFSTFAIKGDRVEWGRPLSGHLAFLGRALPLPLEKLLSTSRAELFADDSERTGLVYAESWAFVHFLIFGRHDIPRRALADYAREMNTGVHPDAAFQRAFGRNYDQVERQLVDYLRGGEYFVHRQPAAIAAKLKVEPASRADVEDALGRLALVTRRWELAAKHARAVTASAADDPRGFEILGSALKESGDTAGGLAAFTRATELGSRDFLPYFELAHAEHGEATSGPIELSSIAPDAARRMANRYERSINLYPRLLPAYQSLAGLVGVAEPWGVEDRQFLEHGRKLFPRDDTIRVGLAVLAWRGGERKAARAQLDAVLTTEPSNGGGDARNYARRLNELWSQQELTEKLDQLMQAQDFNQAAKLIDESLAGPSPVGVRSHLIALRRQLQFSVLSQTAQRAFEEQRWSDARRALEELIASDAPGLMRSQARRALEDLDRRGLGRDPVPE